MRLRVCRRQVGIGERDRKGGRESVREIETKKAGEGGMGERDRGREKAGENGGEMEAWVRDLERGWAGMGLRVREKRMGKNG